MRARIAAAALVLAVARPLVAEELADWFEPFRGAETYLVEDSSWLARDPAAPADAPSAARLRHLVLFLKSDGPAIWWERRNILLVELPNGHRYAAEIVVKRPRHGHLPEPTPFLRITGASGAVETWNEEQGDVGPDGWEPDVAADPCFGLQSVVVGGGRSFRYHIVEGSKPTIRIGLADVRDAAFSGEEREELWSLRRVPSAAAVPMAVGALPQIDNLLGARIAWRILFVDRTRDAEEGRLALVPDPAPPGDIASWRALTYIPQTMPKMEFPAPEDGW